MSETPAETPAEDQQAARPEPETKQQEQDSTDWKAEARKWEQRAKDNRAAATELEKQRKASMTEAEKAVAEAEQRGRTTAVQEFGKRLARTEFDAAAGRRNAEFDTASIFDWLDLAKFVGDDGEPDSKAITAAVERLVPATPQQPRGFEHGPRGQAAPMDMNQLIRRQAGRG